MQEKLLTNMKLKQICFAQTLSVILLAGMSSCSKDPGLNEPDPKPSTTTLWIDGEADPNQTWMTSVSMQLDLSVKGEGMLTAQTIGDNVPVVLGKKQVHDNDVMLIDVPQGIGSFGLVFDNGSVSKQYQCIRLSGDLHQLEKVSFDGASTQALSRQMAPAARAATNTGLYGNSIMADSGYLNFGSWAWNDIAIALVEDSDASKKHTALIDYEIMARGSITAGGEYTEDVNVSFIYGYTGTTASRVLGYYTHSAGSYSDIEYHDISEAISWDYLNGKAKVQYQLDNITGTWYDANFDYQDGNGLPNITSQAADPKRRGDDAYNTLLVKQAYGDQISAVRGLTFKISVPKGNKFGFYLKTNGPLTEDQRTRLSKLGVPSDRMPTNQFNFSYAPMNNVGKHRSAFAIYDNFTFMGLDDSPNNSGDLDCNDVTFVLSNAKGGQYRPQFTEETLNSGLNQGTISKDSIYTKPETPESETGTENLQSWILAFENAGTDVDFDFNDVVLQVVPNTTEHTVAVYLLATGAERNTYIYYGTDSLGEAHELFDVDSANMVNTKLNGLRRNKVLLSNSLSWPAGYTMATHRHLFSIKVTEENGDTTTINSNVMLGDERDIPQVLCVAGKWNWPLEHQNVENAYPRIGDWGRNVNDPDCWNWYSQSASNFVFDYWK